MIDEAKLTRIRHVIRPKPSHSHAVLPRDNYLDRRLAEWLEAKLGPERLERICRWAIEHGVVVNASSVLRIANQFYRAELGKLEFPKELFSEWSSWGRDHMQELKHIVASSLNTPIEGADPRRAVEIPGSLYRRLHRLASVCGGTVEKHVLTALREYLSRVEVESPPSRPRDGATTGGNG